MKLIQLNIWGGDLIWSALRFLKKEDADILNLQEVTAGMKEADSFYFHTYEKLQEALKYEYSFYSPTIESRFENRTVSSGQLILSKYPIKYRRAVYTKGKSGEYGPFSYKIPEVLLLQHAKIDVDGKMVNDLNYHGCFIMGTKTGNKITESHSRKILKYMNSLDQGEQIILSGDFNLTPNSDSLRIIGREYTDLILRNRIRTTRNELSIPKEPVDNIFVNRQVKVKSLKVPKVYVSDHLPLIMTFAWP
jgi:endonuclease/exonuclease/phosphatase family metal-dependent hydrolase